MATVIITCVLFGLRGMNQTLEMRPSTNTVYGFMACPEEGNYRMNRTKKVATVGRGQMHGFA